MKFKLLFIMIMGLLVISPLVSSKFPYGGHFLDLKLAVERGEINTQQYQLCKDNLDLCYSGNILSDISVIYYYTVASRYSATHSPSFCAAMTEEAVGEPEQACAIGLCIMFGTDLVSHEKMVPFAISHTGIVNGMIHSFAEQKHDDIMLKKYPEAKAEAIRALTATDEQGRNKAIEVCGPLFTRVLAGDENFGLSEGKIKQLIRDFIGEVSNSKTGYDTSFTKLSYVPISIWLAITGWLLFWLVISLFLILKKNKTLFNWISIAFIVLILIMPIGTLVVAGLQGKAFSTFQFMIRPISKLVPIGDAEDMTEQSIDLIREYFTKGEGVITGTEASGFTVLDEADRKVLPLNIVIGSLLFGLTLLFLYLNFRKKPDKIGL